MKKFVFSILALLICVACSNIKTQSPPPELSLPMPALELPDSSDKSPNKIEIPVEKTEVETTRTKRGNPFYSYYYYSPDIQTSSELPGYPAQNLSDHTWRSWAEGVKGNGIGESFSIIFYKNHTFTGFALKNGYGNLDYYTRNNRVKSFKIFADDNYVETILIKDSISFEQYIFGRPLECTTLRFVIDDVYPGTEYNDTCIAEIALADWSVDDAEFYENIISWLSTFANDVGKQFENNNLQMVTIPDAERLMLLDYIPFNTSLVVNRFRYFDHNAIERKPVKTKIALLDTPSSLRLNIDLPRIDGATAMYPLYSSFVHAVYPEISPVIKDDHPYGIPNEDFALFDWAYFPNFDLLTDLFEYWHPIPHKKDFGSIVQCNTTSTAYQRLIDGETDIIFCYEPSEAEKNDAAVKGKHFNLTPIAKDAFVFIVNVKNTMDNITQRQVRDIYSGRVTNWKPITGIDEPIIAYQRRENSGSQTILQSIMNGDNLIRSINESEFTSGTMRIIIRNVASNYYNYNAAIGYSFLFYLSHMVDNSGIKVLDIDGIKPTRQNIQNGIYPFVQTVYAITTGSESENTKKFIEWILSDQGQELVEKTGYTPIKFH